MHNSIPSIIRHFQWFRYTQVLRAHILFYQIADNTMQRDKFATKMCKIATKFLYLVTKLCLDFLDKDGAY